MHQGKSIHDRVLVKRKAALDSTRDISSTSIIPAVTARHLTRNLTGMPVVSVATAIVSTALGSYTAGFFDRETGPFIITVAGGIFFLSLLAA
jgi:ABC-type Mn2+/Zn2+ transport system permease subunit